MPALRNPILFRHLQHNTQDNGGVQPKNFIPIPYRGLGGEGGGVFNTICVYYIWLFITLTGAVFGVR